MSGHLSDKKFKEVCEEIAETCACHGGYCFFRNVVTHQHPSIRMLIQFECIEKFKYEESERQNQDIGETDAAMLWSTTELAVAFSKAFDEEKTVKQIYKETLELARIMIKEKCKYPCEKSDCVACCSKNNLSS